MGALGVLLRFEKMPDKARLDELHRALWKRIYARLDGAITSGLTRDILVHYITHQAYEGFESGLWRSFDEYVTFSFRDGGDDFPLKHASYHWTDRACDDPVVFADLQAIARQFDAELQPRPWHPPETVYFPLDDAGALVSVYDDYLDLWTGAGLVRVPFNECPFVDYAKRLVAEQRCLCEVCRKPTDKGEGPVFDPQTLAGIAWNVEVTEAPETFARLEEALEDDGAELPIPVGEIASLTGVARRKAELLIAMRIENNTEDMRVPAALVKLCARWAAPVLFSSAVHTCSHDSRETLRESLRELIALPKPPIVTTGYTVDADGVSILVLRFVGEYVDESDAQKMRAHTDALLATHHHAVGMVLDATELRYASGKGLDDVVRKGRPRAWATSAESRGLYDFIKTEQQLSPKEWLFPSVDDAIAAVRARVVADCYEIHAADETTVVETARREPRGRRHHLNIEEGSEQLSVSTLFDLHGSAIEVVRKRADGSVWRLVEYPVRDAQGNENEACRVGGELTSWGGTLRKVNFNPKLTELPMPLDWVERVAAHPTIDRVSLDRTDVATAEILLLLERCPHLEELYLNKLRLDAEIFSSPLMGKLHRLQLHDVDAPPGAIAQLAALHPWLAIEPRPALETPSATDTAPKPPVETSGRCVEVDGVAILVVSFAGEFDAENAARMKSACDALLTEHPDVLGIVLDGTNLVYEAGKEIGGVVGEGRPWGWVVSAASRGLFEFIRTEENMEPREWLFPSVDAAIAAMRARVVADSYEVHMADAGVWHTWKREPRGRRLCGMRLLDNVRVAYEKLYGPRGRLVEEVYRRSDGTVERSAEWPVRDAVGGENAACRLGARLITVKGQLRIIDYDVAETKSPLPADWIDRVAAHPTVNHVGLDDTGVATTEILRLLERCPQIEQLALNQLTLDAELFASPLLAKLTWLGVWKSVMPPGALQQLAATYPTIDIHPKSALV